MKSLHQNFRVQDEGDSVTSLAYQNHLNNEKLDAYNFEIYPQIRSVSPSSGSTEGGTLITIDGTGFESSLSGATPTTVTVGGKPCEILEISKRKIVCQTPKVENGGNPLFKRKWKEHKTNWDCPNNDITYAKRNNIGTYEDCLHHCLSIGGCVGVVYQPSSGTCWPKWKVDSCSSKSDRSTGWVLSHYIIFI